MIIEYLQNFENNKNNFAAVRKFPTQGCTIEEIEALEESLNNGNPFPKAFREYLFIGGEMSCLPLDMKYSWMERETKAAKKGLLENRGIQLDRPIVVYNQLDYEQYTFIYLDEGDNPQPWHCYVVDDEQTFWKGPFPTFKDNIDKMVELALKGLGL